MIARFGAQRAVVSLAAAMMLMGAKGNGCGPATESDGTSGTGGDDPIACPDGTVFDGMQCVPDDPTDPVCPDGTPGQLVCAATDSQDPSVPPEEQCWIECTDPGTCPPGTHEVVDCPPSCDGTDPGPCSFFCQPDDPSQCPPGSHYEEGCDADVCWAGCVDDGIEPMCPPGTHPEDQCLPEDPMQPSDPMLPPPCKTVCVPDDPTVCPPDMQLEQVCDPMGCYSVCTPIDPAPCPPDTILVTQCDADMTCIDVCLPLDAP